jgi:hypothetical protein
LTATQVLKTKTNIEMFSYEFHEVLNEEKKQTREGFTKRKHAYRVNRLYA